MIINIVIIITVIIEPSYRISWPAARPLLPLGQMIQYLHFQSNKGRLSLCYGCTESSIQEGQDRLCKFADRGGAKMKKKKLMSFLDFTMYFCLDREYTILPTD